MRKGDICLPCQCRSKIYIKCYRILSMQKTKISLVLICEILAVAVLKIYLKHSEKNSC